MDLTPLLPWLRYLHIAGGFAFVAGHGVSMAVAIRLRRENDGQRMLALLDLSAWALQLAGVGLVVLLVAGVLDGLLAGFWSRGWIWASVILLVLIGGLMTPLAGIHFGRMRAALGQRWRSNAKDGDPVPLPIGEVIAMANDRRLDYAAVVGSVGFLVILWLMTFKPF